MSAYFEGLSLSVLEYMAAKNPVAATNVEGTKVLVKEAWLLFEVGDDKKLAEYILKLGSDEKYYEEISQNCYQRAQNYSLNVMVDNYISEYKKVLEKKNEA